VADEGLALFCGLNAMPKNSFLSEYSSRTTPQKVGRLLALWHDHLAGEAILGGQSLNSISTPCPISASIPQWNPLFIKA
jgi:hypothetical protein